jgi:hypothetical protein
MRIVEGPFATRQRILMLQREGAACPVAPVVVRAND